MRRAGQALDFQLHQALRRKADHLAQQVGAGAVEDGLPEPAEDEDAPPAAAEPLGDAGLLSDLGTSRRDLLALVGSERTLPADVISEVCERAGCLDELETLRGT